VSRPIGFDRGEKWTPGPWHIVVNKYGEQVLVETPTDGTLFLLDDDEGIADHPTAEANACLIAAAPELYGDSAFLCARLREFESELLDDDVAAQFYGHVIPAIARLEDALRQARGEQSA
jgi:hypothetical protein